jgi:hypothetical protein
MHGDVTQSNAARTPPSALGVRDRDRITRAVSVPISRLRRPGQYGSNRPTPVERRRHSRRPRRPRNHSAIWIPAVALTGVHAKTVGVSSIQYKRLGAGALIALRPRPSSAHI